MPIYREYNREERHVCAHLLRLLLHDSPDYGPLKQFLQVSEIQQPRVFSEVALIRDAYHARKPDVTEFMDRLCALVADLKGLRGGWRSYTALPDSLSNPRLTHPKQIRRKADVLSIPLSDNERTLYGEVQAMFNAKPDLAICVDDQLYVYEAKFTMGFTASQLERTHRISKVWAKLLHQDLEFNSEPSVTVRTLGLARHRPHVSWEQIADIASRWFARGDVSLDAFYSAIALESDEKDGVERSRSGVGRMR